MKVYISGKITGLPLNQVHAKFSSAEKHLACLGYEVVNPLNNGLTNEHSWAEHMTEDIKLLFGCNAIYLLSDWLESRGSMIEKFIAEMSGLHVLTQTKEDIENSFEVTRETIFYDVESAIRDVTGMGRKDYAIKSRKRELYFARVIFSHQCYTRGVRNKNSIARRIGKSHATILRDLGIYQNEFRVNPRFREVANSVDDRIQEILDFKSKVLQKVALRAY